MNEKLLTEQTLRFINQCLENKDSSFLPLVEFAQKNNLFDSSLYEMWFISQLSQTLLTTSCLDIISNAHVFNLEPNKVNEIFNNLLIQRNSSLIEHNERGSIFSTLNFLEEVNDAGIVFNSFFFEQFHNRYQFLIRQSVSEKFDNLKTKNFKLNLENSLDVKIDLYKASIKI